MLANKILVTSLVSVLSASAATYTVTKNVYYVQSTQGEVGPKEDTVPNAVPRGTIVANGDIGTECAQGPKGETGPQGMPGPKGEAGKDGSSSDAVPPEFTLAFSSTKPYIIRHVGQENKIHQISIRISNNPTTSTYSCTMQAKVFNVNWNQYYINYSIDTVAAPCVPDNLVLLTPAITNGIIKSVCTPVDVTAQVNKFEAFVTCLDTSTGLSTIKSISGNLQQ